MNDYSLIISLLALIFGSNGIVFWHLHIRKGKYGETISVYVEKVLSDVVYHIDFSQGDKWFIILGKRIKEYHYAIPPYIAQCYLELLSEKDYTKKVDEIEINIDKMKYIVKEDYRILRHSRNNLFSELMDSTSYIFEIIEVLFLLLAALLVIIVFITTEMEKSIDLYSIFRGLIAIGYSILCICMVIKLVENRKPDIYTMDKNEIKKLLKNRMKNYDKRSL